MSKQRRMNRFYACVRAIATPIVKLLFWYKAHGVENIPLEGGAVVCCNHTSVSDIAFLIVTCPRQIYFMGKQEIFKNPLIAWFMRKMGVFGVDRKSGGAAAIETAKRIVNEGKLLGIFPEGTRNHQGRPGKAKSGVAVIAAQTGAPVVPSAVYHKSTGLPIFQKNTIRYGKPIPAEDFQMADMSRSEFRRITELIMGKITELWEAGH